MERKLKNKRDLVRRLLYREYGGADASAHFKRKSQFTHNLVKRLSLEHELEGHQGCVNCLQWAPDGRYLASGSDDTNVIIWDPFRHKRVHILPTYHIGNIFSVKFLDYGGETIATAAGDCKVLVQSIKSALEKNRPILECNCHQNRIKRLATSPIEPTLFWSAAEDGLVIQYDLREKHDCSSSVSSSKVLVDLSKHYGEVKCIAVNPMKPYYVAVGMNDCYVRMYDRRKLKTRILKQPQNPDETQKTVPEGSSDPDCVQYYAPGHLAVENSSRVHFKLAVTYIAFNQAGTEMLSNIGGEQIYLFDVNTSKSVMEMKKPKRYEDNKKIKNGTVNGMNGKLKNCCNKSEVCSMNCACFYMSRAKTCLERQWMGDVYQAARDYVHVMTTWPGYDTAYLGLIGCFIELQWSKEAQTWLDYYRQLYPEKTEYSQVKSLQGKINSLNGELSQQDNVPEQRQDRFYHGCLKLEDAETKKRLESIDFDVRFIGHCNTTTDIKEANFLGEDGNFICAGSDEGIIFFWDRHTSEIVSALFGDVSIVNCVQPHPTTCFLASSGIDPVVKLWSPMPECDDTPNSNLVKELDVIMTANQQRMAMDPFESMLVNMGYRLPPGLNVGTVIHELPSCRTS